MMKKYIKINIQVLIAVSFMLFGTSCSDFLEEIDPSNITAVGYFKTPAHAQTALNSAYAPMKSILGGAYGGGPWLMVEFGSGLADSDLGQADNSRIIRDLTNNPDNDYGLSHWNNNYEGIANANLCIANIPGIEMDEALRNKYVGEAKFLRAYYYYQLVRLFGKVPLILEPVDLASPDLYPNQAEVADIYDLIVQDLIDAESAYEALDLPYMDESGRVSLGAIKTMLSSVYLTMAGYPLQLGNPYYTLAANKAQEVIDDGSFSLFPDYYDLYDPTMKNKGENIFMVQYAAFTSPSNWQPHIIPYNLNISAYSAQTGAIYANEEFINSYEPGDKRVEEKEFYYTEFTSKVNRDDTIQLGGYFLYKHFDLEANLNTASSDLNWSIHRYAELLLIHAEALNELGTQDYSGLNAIRDRADLAPLSGLTQDEFRQAVWREKWHELSYENKTWFDMTRIRKGFDVTTGEFVDFVGYKPVYLNDRAMTERELLFPIPTGEILNNTKLVQNDGY
ncbi:MAG: RagB/SusD family nutrient uptake outer membrane protein [Cyclobacteriaceae bacterium]